MNYTIRQLTYLIALDLHKSFGKAAEHCFVSQPTLSTQIKKLEDDLGVILVDRSAQPLKFTETGERVLKQARNAVAEFSAINEISKAEAGTVSGELKLGIIPTLAPYLIPLFLGKFLRAYPDVELKISEYRTDEIVERLQNDALDVGILATPLEIIGIHEQPLFYEKLLAYCDADMAARFGNRISIENLMDDKLWILSEGNCFRNQTINLCSNTQLNFQYMDLVYESGSIDTLMRLVETEGGSTIIPELALDTLEDTHIDRVKFIGTHNPVREISTVVHRTALKADLISALRGTIAKVLPSNIRSNESVGSVIPI